MFEKLLHKRNSTNPKNGKWKEFSKQAVLVAEGNYLDDLKDGLWKQYYESGELLIEEMYDKGMLHGRYASYHLNGRLLSEGDYIDGQREGFFYIYDESGKHVRSLLFVNNILVEEMDLLKPSKLEPEVEATRSDGRGTRSRGIRYKV
jgi:antitoxin component YwqK of YwqJK toxin-antitoxin module